MRSEGKTRKFYLMNALFAYFPSYHILSVSSVTQSCLTLCDSMDCSMPGSLSITNSPSLPKFMSIESVMLSSYLILCRPLYFCPIFPSIRICYQSPNNSLFYFTPSLKTSQFSHLVVSNSLCPHGLQHARLPVHHQLQELAQTHVH